jgi:hypothetical protein
LFRARYTILVPVVDSQTETLLFRARALNCYFRLSSTGWARIPTETYTEVTQVEEDFRREVPAEEDYKAAIDTLFDCGEEIEEAGKVLLS